MTRLRILILILVIIGILATSLVFTSRGNLLKKPVSHASDYSWVIGELEYNPVEGGFWQIRFGKENDPYRGKFVLGEDPKLSRFRHGDLVKITGKISQDQVSIYQSGTLYNLESIDLSR